MIRNTIPMFLIGYISTKNADSKLYKPINSYCSRLAQTVTDFADASHSELAKSTATTVLYGIFRSENFYLCAMTKHVQYTLLLYIRKVTVYNNYRSFAVGYCSRLAQTVTDFADASHSKSAKSTTTTVLYGIFSSENSYPCTVTIIFPLLLPQTPPGSPLTAHRSQG